MNRIHKIVFTMACLLTATGAWAYTIRLNTPSNGTMSSDVTNASHGVLVYLTVNPTGDYYLSELYYEKVVTDIGTAESPNRRSPSFSEKEPIPIKTTNQSNRNNHYGGTYEISMPPYDIEVTAIFSPCTPITGATLHWDSDPSSTSIIYDHGLHTANVYLGSSDLTINADYTIDTNKRTDVGSITPTITGVGTYCGTINDQTISITQKPLTITAQAQTITYGSSIQTGISYVNVSGLVTNDALTSITLTPSTSQVTTTGTITPSGATTTKGISNYAVTYNTGALTIQAYDLSGIASVTFTQDYYNYDGSLHQPSIDNTDGSNMKVYYGNTRLTQGSDFTTSYTATNGVYTNNIDYITPDIYTIDITFTGNYTGSKQVNYQIRPKITLSGNNVWYTYYNLTYNMKMPDEVKAYTISGNTETQINISPDNSVGHGYIKAATPMLLYYTGASTDIYPELVKTGDSHLSGISSYTYYHGLSVATDVTSLTEYSTQDIWILVNNQFVRTASGSIPANRCYLALDKNSITVPHFAPAINFGGLTGIDEPRDKKENVEMKIYNLNGQRVQNPTKGLYIVNGKKVIIK